MATRRPARGKPIDEKDRKALGMRRAGYSWAAIAAELRCTEQAAEEHFNRAVAGLNIPYDTKLEIERAERMHQVAWAKAVNGDLDAMDRVLRWAERRDRLQAAPVDNTHAMRISVEQAVAQAREAKLITALDEGIVSAGLTIADRIDEAMASGEGQEITKALYLIPHLMNVLKEALATPAARKAAGVTYTDAESKRGATLRGLRGGRATEAG